MNKLGGREIVILSESIEDYNQEDLDHYLPALTRIKEQLTNVGVTTRVVEVTKSIEEALATIDPAKVVIFNWCEELDGVPNTYSLAPPVLEKLGFCYTGSNAAALTLTQNKKLTKEVLISNGISTPKATFYLPGESARGWDVFPAIIKPVTEHCSEGITRDSVVQSREELEHQLSFALARFKDGAFVEEFIDGPEYMVSVWGGLEYEVLPIVELDYSKLASLKDKIFSFNAKWVKDSFEYTVITETFPEIGEPLKSTIDRLAIDAFVKTGCANYGRLEIRIKGSVPYVLDVNANPDMVGPNEFIM